MLFDPKIKPRLWNLKTGVITYGCARMELPPPVLAMLFRERTRSKTFDYGKHKNHGTNTDISLGPDYLIFNGSSSIINIGDANTVSLMPTTGLAIATCVRRSTALLNFSGIFRSPQQTNNSGYMLVGDADEKIRIYIAQGSPDWKNVTSANAINQDEWVTICGTWDGSNINLYINNIAQTPTACSGINYATPSQNARIGQYATTYWPGDIKYMYVFPVGLNQIQVQTLYNNPYGMFRQVRSLAIWSFVSGEGETFYKTVTGILPNPDGTVNTILLYKHSVYGDMPNTISSIAKDIGKGLIGNQPTSHGVIVRRIGKYLTGSQPTSQGEIVKDTAKVLVGNQPNALADLDTVVVQQKSISGNMPELNATLSSKLVGSQSIFGNIPNAIGVIVKRISKYLVGSQPTSQGIIVKGTGKYLTGNQPNATSNVKRKITTKKTGIMGAISGAVSSILNPVGPGIVKLYRLIGSSLKKFIG